MTAKATPGRSADSGGPTGAPPVSPGKPPWRLLAFGMIAIVLAGALAVTALVIGHQRGTAITRPSGIPADMPTGLANLMLLSPLPRQQAPGFTLTDQAGRTMALSGLRGKVVVLEFMDPHCTDICPIVSQEFVDAYHELGAVSSKVVFAAINVNQYHASVRDMAAYSTQHQMSTIPGWHFFTGPLPALKTAWRDYNIQVEAPNPNADIVHTSAVYFIDARGAERYLATPMVEHTANGTAYLPPAQIAAWAGGIARLAGDLAR
jgi:cytochrome oxidase Cu insertion factor (SCO1/SenC/PrrC family)